MTASSRLPRLLFVITDLDVGGVPLHLLRLAPAVRDAGFSVAVVSLKPPGPVGDRLREAGIDVVTCAARGSFDWRVVDRLGAVIGEFSPDVVHTFLFHANLAGRIAAGLCGFSSSRLVCEIQTVEIERSWHLLGDRLTHRLCRCNVGNSPSVIDHLHRQARVPRSRLRLIPGGVDVARFIAAAPLPRAELGAGPDDRLVFWVGRMDPVKALDTLIAAVNRLPRAMGVRLLLVGDGPERGRVERDIARLGLDDRVRLLGRRDDVPRLLKSADLFVLPSRTEGLPNALLEAMAAGVPVVATDVPGNRDLVTDGVTGRLVCGGDVASLTAAIERSLNDSAASCCMADAARELIDREYTLARCHERYLALYREILGGRRTA